MFNLKEKLLAQGLVTKEQAARVENIVPDFSGFERKKALEKLKSQNKAEKYITIRKWVDVNRLDKESLISSENEKFFFANEENQVSWLSLPKEIIDAIAKGKAGVISYMSNHGLVHAVVPRDIAEDIREAFPEWVKVLND
jgi:uncharacterized protein YaiL (DUF2058 family)